MQAFAQRLFSLVFTRTAARKGWFQIFDKNVSYVDVAQKVFLLSQHTYDYSPHLRILIWLLRGHAFSSQKCYSVRKCLR